MLKTSLYYKNVIFLNSIVFKCYHEMMTVIEKDK
jgi:hypothetical protein